MSTALQLTFEPIGPIHVVCVANTPRLDQSNHETVGAGLMQFLEANPGGNLLVSLEGIEFISSVALSELIQALRAASREGGGLRVCAAAEYVASVFEVTRLDKTFCLGGAVREAAKQYAADLATRAV